MIIGTLSCERGVERPAPADRRLALLAPGR